MSSQALTPNWKMVKFGEPVKNGGLVERHPGANALKESWGSNTSTRRTLHIDPNR